MHNIKQSTFEKFQKIGVMIESLLHPLCEVVIHDFSNLDHSIVFIKGNITNRSVDGAATNLLIEQLRSDGEKEMITNYYSSLPGGRQIKSSTLFLKDDTGKIYGAFCINLLISDFMTINKLLSRFLNGNDQINEYFTDNVSETIQYMITETLHEMGGYMNVMSKDDKIELVRLLDKKGLFQMKHSVTILAEQLNVTRTTIYNYLRECR